MHLIVGLGNPGKQYENTRHNVGWMVVDAIAAAHGFGAWSSKFKGMVAKGKIDGVDVVLLKPQTYMNLSGESVRPAMDFYKAKPGDVVVVHDELDIAFGALRAKIGGGDAGHNGLKSITQHLGTADYVRVRFGIGRPEHKSQVSAFVLHPFSKAERAVVDEVCGLIAKNAGAVLEDAVKAVAALMANR
jgi:PTH1 family peptidyl-tRNA hydrolase